MRTTIRALAASILLAVAAPSAHQALAQPAPPAAAAAPSAEEIAKAKAAREKQLDDIQASLKPQTGRIALPDAKAGLDLGDKYYFLGPADARKVLTEAWGNPPESADGVLGMIFPAGTTLRTSAYGVVVEFEDSGYVTDSEVGKNDYDKLLADMQKAADEANPERVKHGFDPVKLVGWAQPPSYDRTAHNLIWARNLEFGGDPEHVLNYDVRHLGRRGVLNMSFIAKMSDLEQLRPVAAELARTAEFDAGARYADHADGDKMAGYGLVGLIGAGAGLLVAKKIGLIGVGLLLAKKFAVVILAFFGAIGAWFRRVLGLKPKAPKAPALTDFGGEPSALEAPEPEPEPAKAVSAKDEPEPEPL